MKSVFFHKLSQGVAVLGAAIVLGSGAGLAQPKHGIAMYGDPALPPDFVSLPHVNPNAPKGGVFVDGQVGSFDSLNPHIRKGRVPWQLRFIAYESMMQRSYDEPFTLYGLLAESVEVDPDAMWVEFTLNPAARFSDGSPVTINDVIWSYETLGTEGHPRYLGAWQKIDSIEAVGERGVRLTFNEADRELALIMGLRPILKAAQWDGVDFADSGVDVIPISSAPYVITDFEAGRFVELTRDADYWGADLPVRVGTNNIGTIRMEFFGDGTAMFEAFKTGILSTMRETSAANWDRNYNFPRVASGEVVKSIIPHLRPSGITGLVMNTRRDLFQDWRVREALIQAFNYEFINETLNGGVDPRITSYFSNSVLSMNPGAAEGRVRELLEPYAAELIPGTLEGYALPVSNGSEANRAGIRQALALFEEAGYTVIDGVMTDPTGEAVTFEIVNKIGSSEVDSIVAIYAEALARLGITPTITNIDDAQYKERTDAYDFDMTWYRRGLSLSPGNEQFAYWGADGVTAPGSRNLMGINSAAAEAMINEMLTAPSQDGYRAAVRALDRILTAGRYVIPVNHNPVSRLAHNANLKFRADRLPMYGDWIGFQPDVWWIEE